jgi:nucleoside-triphosphatase THEP1
MIIDKTTKLHDIIVLSGISGSGKTKLCSRLCHSRKNQGCDIAGILTLPFYQNGNKTQLIVENIRSGECHPLANLTTTYDGPEIGKWRFNSEGLEKGLIALKHSTPCDILVIDELGPLELLHGEGWFYALKLLKKVFYRQALVVIRPRLLPEFYSFFPDLNLTTLMVTEETFDITFVKLDRLLGNTR